jgi:ribosomal protein S18 acetylase RimI-like enzyme
MEITVKNKPLIEDLDFFFKTNPKGQETFRYYLTRDYSVINNHIKTVLFFDGSTPIAYGHLDNDGQNIWLGIMVSDNCNKKGYGMKMMDYLLEGVNYSICLTVDKSNINAYNLYIKKGFQIISENDLYYKMIKN